MPGENIVVSAATVGTSPMMDIIKQMILILYITIFNQIKHKNNGNVKNSIKKYEKILPAKEVRKF